MNSPWWYRRIQPLNPQIGIARWRPESLHRNQPRRRRERRDTQRLDELIAELSGLLGPQVRLELLALVVRLSEFRHGRLALEFEERLVQLLIVDVDLAHFGLDPFPRLLAEGLVGLFGLDGVTLLADTGVGDPGCVVSANTLVVVWDERYELTWKEVWRFLDTPLAGEVVPFGVPVGGNGDGTVCQQVFSVAQRE